MQRCILDSQSYLPQRTGLLPLVLGVPLARQVLDCPSIPAAPGHQVVETLSDSKDGNRLTW